MAARRKTGLVLTGGGARGAYQAGVIRALAEIAQKQGLAQPFDVLTGFSAGAINAAYLAAQAQDMHQAVRDLYKTWEQVHSDQVFKVDAFSLAAVGIRGLFQLVTGGLLKEKNTRALLDTSPLRKLIETSISVLKVQNNVEAGHLQGIGITAVNYSNGYSNTFFQSHKTIQPWNRIRRTSERTQICPDHIMASTAIPVLFPPARVGDCYFGDGSLRNHTPLSPAIKLGAEKLIVIGVRREEKEPGCNTLSQPSPGRIFSVLLNSILLDALDIDCERVLRINETLAHLTPWAGVNLRKIETLVFRPSEDVGTIASEESESMPRVLRYLLKGLGSPEENEGLLSYLLFEPPFTKRLLELGYKDTMAREEEVAAFLSS